MLSRLLTCLICFHLLALAGAGIEEILLKPGAGAQFRLKYEQVENGRQHLDTHEQAAQEAAGFSLQNIRVWASGAGAGDLITWKISGSWTNQSVLLLDCKAGYCPWKFLEFRLGQMKLPLSSEALASPYQLDFINRSSITSNLMDWALVRTPYIGRNLNSLCYGRDAGVALEGEIGGDIAFRYSMMLGNGFGANHYMGGHQHHESGGIFADGVRGFLASGRLEGEFRGLVCVGVFGSRNRHENFIENDKKTVRHLDREAMGTDLAVQYRLLKLAGTAAFGRVGDNYPLGALSEADALCYGGWETRLIAGRFWNIVEMGVRYERVVHEYNENGYDKVDDNLTLGVNAYYFGFGKAQLNYLVRLPRDRRQKADHLRDNLLVLNLQFAAGR